MPRAVLACAHVRGPLSDGAGAGLWLTPECSARWRMKMTSAPRAVRSAAASQAPSRGASGARTRRQSATFHALRGALLPTTSGTGGPTLACLSLSFAQSLSPRSLCFRLPLRCLLGAAACDCAVVRTAQT